MDSIQKLQGRLSYLTFKKKDNSLWCGTWLLGILEIDVDGSNFIVHKIDLHFKCYLTEFIGLDFK